MTRRPSRAAALVAVATLLLAACGTRVKDETRNAANGGVGGGSGQTTGTAGGVGSTTSFGTIPIPCGPGDGSGNTASDKGVTPTAIKISTLADPGGIKQGLNQGVFDAMDAFAKWCNDLGGINGRKIELTLRDAKLTEWKERVVDACSDFAMVGSLGVLDSLGAQAQVDCGLPNVAAETVNPEQSGADLTFAPTPNPPWNYPVGTAQLLKERYPEAAQGGGMIYNNLPTTEMQSSRQIEAYEKVGWKFVYRQASNVNETAWAPLIVGMKNANVNYVALSSSWEEAIPMQEAMAEQGFKPQVTEFEANFYNDNYAKQAPPSANGTLVRVQTWPFEEADQNPSMQQFLDIYKKYEPNGVKEYLAVKAFSAGLLWATAVKALGANVTRAGLVEQLKQVTEWDGGGLHAPGSPGTNERGTCVILMKVQDGKFVREYPKPDADKGVYENSTAKGYFCPDPATAIVPITSKDYRAMGAKAQGSGK